MGALGIILLPVIIIFIIIPLIVIAVMANTSCFQKTKARYNLNSENDLEIGCLESKLDKTQIRLLYKSIVLEDFLYKRFPNLKEWKDWEAQGNIFHHFDGLHKLRLTFWDGTRKDVVICINGDMISVRENVPEETQVDPKEIANEWLKKMATFFQGKKDGEGFSMENKEFPEEATVKELILDALTEQGFMVQEESDLVRLIFPAA